MCAARTRANQSGEAGAGRLHADADSAASKRRKVAKARHDACSVVTRGPGAAIVAHAQAILDDVETAEAEHSGELARWQRQLGEINAHSVELDVQARSDLSALDQELRALHEHCSTLTLRRYALLRDQRCQQHVQLCVRHQCCKISPVPDAKAQTRNDIRRRSCVCLMRYESCRPCAGMSWKTSASTHSRSAWL